MSTQRKVYSLYEVALAVERAIAERVRGRTFWVRAEMVELNHYPHSGHCYPEFAERRDGRLVAKMRGVIWRDDYERIQAAFRRMVGEPLADGMEILFLATVQYHPVYGLSLHVQDVDPTFSLGELERRRRQTIEQLRKEGLFDRNRMLTLPVLPKVWAVISVETSKGYRDFRSVVDSSPYGVMYWLFPALLQGEGAVRSIVGRLRQIAKYAHLFDAVAIIRGGGGEVGLRAYDDYDLARTIALHPLPVLTGIGHSTNQTVAELVSWKSFITPTDLARFVVERFATEAEHLKDARRQLVQLTRWRLEAAAAALRQLQSGIRQRVGERLVDEKGRLRAAGRELRRAVPRHMRTQTALLQSLAEGLRRLARRRLETEGQQLHHWRHRLDALSPQRVLRRGYTLTMVNGKVVTSVDKLRAGTVIETRFADGAAESVVLKTQKSAHEHQGDDVQPSG